MIIEIEGLDGTGKSTQAKLLAARLNAKLFQFPDRNTVSGKLIEKMLKGEEELHENGKATGGCYPSPFAALALQLAMTANRLEHAQELAERKLRRLPTVLDRYWPSGYAYGAADGLDPTWLDALHRTLPQPDLHILLWMEPDEAIRRIRARTDKPRQSYESTERLRAAAGHYHRLWRERWRDEPLRWVIVNADDTLDVVQAEIIRAVEAVPANQRTRERL